MFRIENNYLAAGVVIVTAILLVLSRDWRASIMILAGQYVGVFFLVTYSWTFSVASIVLLAGWISCVVLVTAIVSVPELLVDTEPSAGIQSPMPRRWVSAFIRLLNERAFYMAAALLILIVVSSLIPRVLITFPGIPPEHAWSALILIGLGLLITGFSNNPLDITIGLLIWLSGFEIIYSTVQSSLLIAGLLSGITLVISLAGAYFLLSGYMESQY